MSIYTISMNEISILMQNVSVVIMLLVSNLPEIIVIGQHFEMKEYYILDLCL